MAEVVLVLLVVLALYAQALSYRTYEAQEGAGEHHDASLTMLYFPTLSGLLRQEEAGEEGVGDRDRMHYTR